MDELILVKKKKKESNNIKELYLENEKNNTLINVFNIHYSSKIKAHESDILCLEKYKNYFISGSSDKTIKIFDIYTSNLIHTFDNHNGAIHNLCVWDDKLVSVSSDKTIKIWNLEYFKLECTILAHTNHIYSISGEDNFFVTSALDKTIKTWNLKERKLLKVIKTGEYTAWKVLKHKDLIFAGFSDGSLAIYDFYSGEQKFISKIHNDSITNIKYQNGLIFTSSKDKTIKIFNLSKLDIENTINFHNSSIWDIFIQNKTLISCSDDKTLKLIDINNNKEKQSISLSSQWLSSLISIKNKVITSSGDGYLYIFDKLPEYNCNNINLDIETRSKSPFETQEEFDKIKIKLIKDFYEKITNYEYIQIGKVELIENTYNLETKVLRCKLLLNCNKINDLSNLKKDLYGFVEINTKDIQKILSKSYLFDLYIKYKIIESELKYDLAFIFQDRIYNIIKIEPFSKENKSIEIKQDRLNIQFHQSNINKNFIDDNIKFVEDNEIETSDTFRKTFESINDFKDRVFKKLIDYGFINIGKIELFSEKYSIEKQLFPLKIEINSKKLLNLISSKEKLDGYIYIDRITAKKLFEKSNKHNLYIKFIHIEDNIFFELIIVFNNEIYFIKLKEK